jgi:tyrosyl-DNA phosphodiesterase-1
MAKRPIEVLVLDSDSEDDIAPIPSTSRSQPSPRNSQRPVGEGATEEDRQFEQELAMAMAASLGQENSTTSTAELQPHPRNTAAAVGAGSSRAEMEQARLERQRMRELSGLTAPAATVRTTNDGANKRARVSTFADLPDDPAAPSTSASSSSSARIATLASLPTGSSSSSSRASDKSSQRFWDGAIKRVPNVYHPDSDSWSFSDLIGPHSTLDAAIVSAFCLDPEWVVPQFPRDTPLLLVMPRPAGDNVPNPAQCDLKPNTYRVCPPHLAPGDYGVMHIKFQVRLPLFSSVIPSY